MNSAIMRAFARFGLGAVCIWAMACATTPEPNYFTLDMRSSGAVQAACDIDVTGIRPSDALSKSEILIERSPTEIEYYAVARWAEGVGHLVRHKLDIEFGQGHSNPRVIMQGTILAFGQVDRPGGADAHIMLSLRMRDDKNAESSFERIYEARIPAKTSSASAVVEALSHGLEQLAVEIAADAATFVNK